jgi:hypothetical protein
VDACAHTFTLRDVEAFFRAVRFQLQDRKQVWDCIDSISADVVLAGTSFSIVIEDDLLAQLVSFSEEYRPLRRRIEHSPEILA